MTLAVVMAGVFAVASPARAQEAMPVPAVDAATLPAPVPGGGPVVLELFTSQACVFCPRADRLFADLVSQPNVIGFSCHTDYFDVREGSLARPFCTGRQKEYERLLRAGPLYTPQMVLQGTIEVVAYRMQDVIAAMRKAAQEYPVMPLQIIAPKDGTEFRVALPDTAAPLPAAAVLYLAVYDRPHDITIAEGRNKGQAVSYAHVASEFRDLGPWPSGQQGVAVAIPPLTDAQEGFALLLQDSATGKILGAGKYDRN